MKKVLLVIVALFLPPVTVAIHKGFGKDLLINVLLTILFFIPGFVHALWLLFK